MRVRGGLHLNILVDLVDISRLGDGSPGSVQSHGQETGGGGECGGGDL